MSESGTGRKNSSFLAVLGQFTSQVFGLISLLILLRVVSREAYGMWALYLTVLSMAEMARAGFVQNGLVSFVQASPDQGRRIIGSAYLLNLLLGLLLWGILMAVAPLLARWWSAPALPVLTAWYGLFMLCLGGLRFLEYVQIARQDFRGVLLGNLLYGGGQCLVMAYWWLTGYSPELHLLIWVQAGAAALGAAAVWLYRRPLFVWGMPSWHWIQQLANYGRYVLGTNLGSMLLQRVDVIMIGFFLGPNAVAPYNVALRITSYLEVPLRGLSVAVFPRIGKAWKEEGPLRVARLYEKTTAEMLALTLPVCIVLALFAPLAVQIVAGQGYEDAVLLLRVLLLFALIKPWGRMFGTTLDAIGKPQVNFRYIMLGVVVNVAFNFGMIPLLGVVGTAYATVLATILMAGINQWQLARLMPVRIWQVFGDLRGAYNYWYGRINKRSQIS
jgi:lipopolysaccharide exporter